MASYTKMTVGKENRTELHEKLALTGAEISLNTLPAGANVPFVHSHKANEEIYGVLSGKGKVVIDGEEISLAAGDWLKISPVAKRQFFAASNSEITYICILTNENTTKKSHQPKLVTHVWWRIRDSNPRPPACDAGALTS